MEAYPSSNPRRPSALAKLDQAMGTLLGYLEEATAPVDPSLEAKLKEDRSVSREARAFWQALLSTMDAMSAAIYYQAEKQETQVDLLNVLAVHIVSIDKKLQGLNDLLRWVWKRLPTASIINTKKLKWQWRGIKKVMEELYRRAGSIDELNRESENQELTALCSGARVKA
ncbi:hypothetical protein NDU88_005466 [Pleurodeles waltl]|uniref:Uncharacterized protein n=1 Tax=Pleurodeles waltl TaxID=8319 RepID=A0AAV7UL51_PLEWA|nr:hypothetical protein NDU88_005466 [Pleurodeles waltl]